MSLRPNSFRYTGKGVPDSRVVLAGRRHAYACDWHMVKAEDDTCCCFIPGDCCDGLEAVLKPCSRLLLRLLLEAPNAFVGWECSPPGGCDCCCPHPRERCTDVSPKASERAWQRLPSGESPYNERILRDWQISRTEVVQLAAAMEVAATEIQACWRGARQRRLHRQQAGMTRRLLLPQNGHGRFGTAAMNLLTTDRIPHLEVQLASTLPRTTVAVPPRRHLAPREAREQQQEYQSAEDRIHRRLLKSYLDDSGSEEEKEQRDTHVPSLRAMEHEKGQGRTRLVVDAASSGSLNGVDRLDTIREGVNNGLDASCKSGACTSARGDSHFDDGCCTSPPSVARGSKDGYVGDSPGKSPGGSPELSMLLAELDRTIDLVLPGSSSPRSSPAKPMHGTVSRGAALPHAKGRGTTDGPAAHMLTSKAAAPGGCSSPRDGLGEPASAASQEQASSIGYGEIFYV